MIPEPAATAETNPIRKTLHCAPVKPNKLRVFMSLGDSESGKLEIANQAF
jgi:hypothetical protein